MIKKIMWSSIVGKKEVKKKKKNTKKLLTNFDKPFNVEFIPVMVSFITLPKDLVGIIEEYLQPIFNKIRYINTSLSSYFQSYIYEGYKFYRRFNILNTYKKNYRFTIKFSTKSDSSMFGKYKNKMLYDVSVELFDYSSDKKFYHNKFYYKHSLVFPREHLKYLCSLSYKNTNDIFLFNKYLLKLEIDSEYPLNYHVIKKFKYEETLIVWDKVFKDVCIYFDNLPT